MSEEEQDVEEQEQEAKRPGMTSAQAITSLAGGATAFTLLDVLSHGGAAGALAGGAIATWIIWRHGGEALAFVQDTFLTGGAAQPTLPSPPRDLTRRSWRDRALGHFPVQERETGDAEQVERKVSGPDERAGVAEFEEPRRRSLQPPHPAYDSQEETRPAPTPVAEMRPGVLMPPGSSLTRPAVSCSLRGSASERFDDVFTTRLRLSPQWQPDIEEVNGQRILAYGATGSGKTTIAALVAEQVFDKFLPGLVFDKEGDFQSLIDTVGGRPLLRNGWLAGASGAGPSSRCPARYLDLTLATAQQIAALILAEGYQLVVDLRTYSHPDARARIMAHLLKALMSYADALPQEEDAEPGEEVRVPCLIFWDEAAYLFPQSKSVSYLSTGARKELLDVTVEVVQTGRKRGMIPAFFTQRPAPFDKDVTGTDGITIFLRQQQDVDIERYREYLPDDIARSAPTWERGQGYVLMNGVAQFVAFYPRQSVHVSATPKAATALRRFGTPRYTPGTGRNPLGRHGDRRSYPVPLASVHPVPPLYRPDPPPDPVQGGTGWNPLLRRAEQDQEKSMPVPMARDEKRFTPEQERQFRRYYQETQSIKAALTRMHVGYGRYHRHASQIAQAMNRAS